MLEKADHGTSEEYDCDEAVYPGTPNSGFTCHGLHFD